MEQIGGRPWMAPVVRGRKRGPAMAAASGTSRPAGRSRADRAESQIGNSHA